MQPIIQVHLTKSDEIYELFDVLKMGGTSVESIDRDTVNFEQIFMKIVKGEKEYVLG
jgi:ABC-2 type transport system ATP-binding protein